MSLHPLQLQLQRFIHESPRIQDPGQKPSYLCTSLACWLQSCSHHHLCLNCDWSKTLNPCWNCLNRHMACQPPKTSDEPWTVTDKIAFQYSPQQIFHKGRVNFVPKFISSLCCRDALNGSLMCRTDTYLCNPDHTDGEPATNQENLQSFAKGTHNCELHTLKVLKKALLSSHLKCGSIVLAPTAFTSQCMVVHAQ